MGVFNWLKFEAECLACGKTSQMHCQTKVASSAGGDETGRFCDRWYTLGEKMAWWNPKDRDYEEWRWCDFNDDFEDEHSCLCSTNPYCPACNKELYFVIKYVDLVPESIIGSGLEENWADEVERFK